jgi:hypothetical protein
MKTIKSKTFMILGILLTSILFTACMNKDSYMANFEKFIADTGNNYSDYSDKDWQEKDTEYKNFSEKWYEKFKDELTMKEKVKITGYQVKYNYYRTLNQASSVFNSLFETLNVDKIRQEVQYYIDNNMQSDLEKFYDEARKAGKAAEETVTEILEELKVNVDELKKELE